MAVLLKLQQAGELIDLNSGRYCLGADYGPPSTQYNIAFSRAPKGAVLVEKTAENTTFEFSLHIEAASVSEARRAVQNLASFLNRAGNKLNPLELHYREYDDYTYEVFFGQHGAFTRFQVEFGELNAGSDWFIVQTSGGKKPNARLRLVVRPHPYGIFQHAGQATGGVIEDHIGKTDGTMRGTVIPEATTNKMTNPIFEYSTYDIGWTLAGTGSGKAQQIRFASGNNRGGASRLGNTVLFGRSSTLLETSTTNMTYTQSIDVGNTNTHVLSFYVKGGDGAAITSSDVQVYYGSASDGDGYVSVGDGWYRVYKSVTGVASATATGINVLSDARRFYVDGFQMEEKAYPTPLCYGDLMGCTWAGTAHNSTSTRTAGRVSYTIGHILHSRMDYSLRVIWMPGENASPGVARTLFEDSSDQILAQINSSDAVVFNVDSGSGTTSAAQTFTARTPVVFHFTFDGTTATIYKDGTSISSTGSLAAPTTNASTVYIGSTDEVDTHANGTFLGVATFPETMTAADVLADYNEVWQLANDDDRIDPLPYVWTEQGDNILDAESDETDDYPYMVIGGLVGDDIDIEMRATSSSTLPTYGGLTFASLPMHPRLFIKDVYQYSGGLQLLFRDGDDSTADTASNNELANAISQDTSATNYETIAVSAHAAELLNEVDTVYGSLVMKKLTGANVQARMGITLGSTEQVYTKWRPISADTVYAPYTLGPLAIPKYLDPLEARAQTGFVFGVRQTSGSGTARISHVCVMPNMSTVYLGDAPSSVNGLFIKNEVARLLITGTSTRNTIGFRFFNRKLFLKADKMNVVLFQHYTDNYDAGVNAFAPDLTFTINEFRLRPRWEVY